MSNHLDPDLFISQGRATRYEHYMKPPTSLEDDNLSHEPDFSFRQTQPIDLDFTGRQPVISAAQAAAKIQQPPAEPSTPASSVPPIPAVAIAVTETPAAPTENVQVTIMRQQRPQVSGLAVAGFVLALAGIITPFFLLPFIISILALILGHIGAHQARKQHLGGRGLGIAAYVISYMTILLTLIIIAALTLLGIGAYNSVDQFITTYGSH